MLGALFSLYTYTLGSGSVAISLPNLPSWYTVVLALLSLVELAAAVLLWQWKKMGFKLYVASAVVVAILKVIYLGAGSLVFPVLGILILYLVMKPVWANFK